VVGVATRIVIATTISERNNPHSHKTRMDTGVLGARDILYGIAASVHFSVLEFLDRGYIDELCLCTKSLFVYSKRNLYIQSKSMYSKQISIYFKATSIYPITVSIYLTEDSLSTFKHALY